MLFRSRQGGGDATDIRRVWIDDMYVMPGANLFNPVRLAAHAPSPINGAANVALTASLSWNTGRDPNNVEAANPKITHHYVYLRTDPNFVGMTTPTATIAAAGLTASYVPSGLSQLLSDKTYYWRVDEALNNAPPTHATNIIRGTVWNFATVKSAPIVTGQPTPALVNPAHDAVFTVNFASYSPAFEMWYKYVDGVNDLALTAGSKYAMVTDNKTYAALTVKNATVADQEIGRAHV